MLKLIPKRQRRAESTRVLITEFIFLFEKERKEVQVSIFLIICKEDKDVVSKKANFIEQNLLHILAMAIYKANIEA